MNIGRYKMSASFLAHANVDKFSRIRWVVVKCVIKGQSMATSKLYPSKFAPLILLIR